jgi:hypothetical protein
MPTATDIEGFGVHERRSASEIAASAMQAEAMAAIQARYIVARQNPRDLVRFRQSIMSLCRNPKFADEALYEKPVGRDETVTDFSIRFAEAVVRFYGNLDVSTEATFDDDRRRKIRVTATDLENNATFRADRMLEKTVERKYPNERKVLAERLNSKREKVYIVEATEEEFLTKEAAAASKLIRTNIMRFVDEDLKDECHRVIETTLKTTATNDPAARITRLVQAFAKFGIEREKLNEALGHPIENSTPDEIVQLTKHWVGLREGESWTDIRDAVIAKRTSTATATTGSGTGATPHAATSTVAPGAGASGAASKSDALAEKLTGGGNNTPNVSSATDTTPKSTPSGDAKGPSASPEPSGAVTHEQKQENATAGRETQKPPAQSSAQTQNLPTGGELFPRDDKPSRGGSKTELSR